MYRTLRRTPPSAASLPNEVRKFRYSPLPYFAPASASDPTSDNQSVPTTERLRADEPEHLRRAAQLLRAGHTVAFPTETVYGLGANALDPAAVEQIFLAKQRPHWDPLIVHIADPGQLPRIATFPPDPAAAHTARQLLNAFWPGPLTLLLPRTPAIPDAVTAGRALVGVRMPQPPGRPAPSSARPPSPSPPPAPTASATPALPPPPTSSRTSTDASTPSSTPAPPTLASNPRRRSRSRRRRRHLPSRRHHLRHARHRGPRQPDPRLPPRARTPPTTPPNRSPHPA